MNHPSLNMFNPNEKSHINPQLTPVYEDQGVKTTDLEGLFYGHGSNSCEENDQLEFITELGGLVTAERMSEYEIIPTKLSFPSSSCW